MACFSYLPILINSSQVRCLSRARCLGRTAREILRADKLETVLRPNKRERFGAGQTRPPQQVTETLSLMHLFPRELLDWSFEALEQESKVAGKQGIGPGRHWSCCWVRNSDKPRWWTLWFYQDAGHGGHGTYATTWMDKPLVGDGFRAKGQQASWGQPRFATRQLSQQISEQDVQGHPGPVCTDVPALENMVLLHGPDCLTFPQASCFMQNWIEGKSSRHPCSWWLRKACKRTSG